MWKSSTSATPAGLPVYKDKKQFGGMAYGSRRPVKPLRGKKRGILILALFGIFLYVMYTFGMSVSEEEEGRTSPIAQRILTKSKARTDAGKKQAAIRQAFLDSWKGYEKYAWGKDIYKPVSKAGENMISEDKPLGWIIVDSLDTLHIMGLNDQLKRARDWVKNDLSYDIDHEVNTFETTIRMLGGLLSAHYLTKDRMYLEKATDLGHRLAGAFESKSGIPYASVNLHSGAGVSSHMDAGASSTAEAATLQLEFKYLAQLTGETQFWTSAQKVMEVMDGNHMPGGLVPIFIQPSTGEFQGRLIRLGSRGDSYYEYLIKQYLQTQRQEPVYKEMYDEASKGIRDHMVAYSEPNHLTYIGELPDGLGGQLSPKMDHLVCFAGGMFALGATNGELLETARRKPDWSVAKEADMKLAMEITRTCYETYHKTDTGLGPEIVFFNHDKQNTEDFTIKTNDAHNLQRPETVESLYILYRLTKNPIYREWGWNIFEAFEKWTRVDGDGGYASIENVRKIPPTFRDNMESFWLSETLKYLYLLFEDDDSVLPLDKIVFNTEAHPLPQFEPMSKFASWTRD